MKKTLTPDKVSDYKLNNFEKVLMSKEHASSDTITTKTLGLIGRLPHFGRDTRLSNIKKANRYLGFQEKRIMNMLSSGNKKGALLT